MNDLRNLRSAIAIFRRQRGLLVPDSGEPQERTKMARACHVAILFLHAMGLLERAMQEAVLQGLTSPRSHRNAAHSAHTQLSERRTAHDRALCHGGVGHRLARLWVVTARYMVIWVG